MGAPDSDSDGVQNLIEKGYKRMSPFFIPYAITNMGSALLAIDKGLMGPNSPSPPLRDRQLLLLRSS